MINEYIQANKDRFLDELIELLKIPSVSADPAYKDDVKNAADFLKEQFVKMGVDRVEVMPTAGHPVV